uniref:MCM C-terminal AAA(+) ATPase domain-containing protein n=1 Tax=Chromera velia CCMP2878 TaxID=1169474 RepID=A0A0G4GWX1_9ALVE|eukprot:Cvel_23709.t1-p1 / transcript=Cvel_23709.t1 / gene=Cvel_23709 / organism=Chromera_velia_CCMP2878 / gene_product=DNA helicase MCM8, putative / transcript_product=DNA helicase MCM8, putative / location=Cvel_scaffold2475:13090-23289(-) / protein_length=1027 / sequence_SO=supercontig / SO=protein_coding / is_pseudo=false
MSIARLQELYFPDVVVNETTINAVNAFTAFFCTHRDLICEEFEECPSHLREAVCEIFVDYFALVSKTSPSIPSVTVGPSDGLSAPSSSSSSAAAGGLPPSSVVIPFDDALRQYPDKTLHVMAMAAHIVLENMRTELGTKESQRDAGGGTGWLGGGGGQPAGGGPVGRPRVGVQGRDGGAAEGGGEDDEDEDEPVVLQKKIQVRVYNLRPFTPLASLRADKIGHLLAVRGTIVRAAPSRPVPVVLTFTCVTCGSRFVQKSADGKGLVPRACQSKGCNGRVFVPDRKQALTTDFQKLKLQEDFSALYASSHGGSAASSAASSANAGGSVGLSQGVGQSQGVGMETSVGGERHTGGDPQRQRAPANVEMDAWGGNVECVTPGERVVVLGIVRAEEAGVGADRGRLGAAAVEGGKLSGSRSVFVLKLEVVSLASASTLTPLVRQMNACRDSSIGFAPEPPLGLGLLRASRVERGARWMHRIWACEDKEKGNGNGGGQRKRRKTGETTRAPFLDLTGGDGEAVEAQLRGGSGGAGRVSEFTEKELGFVAEFFSAVDDHFALLVASFAPHILGMESVKAALVLCLLGGVAVFEGAGEEEEEEESEGMKSGWRGGGLLSNILGGAGGEGVSDIRLRRRGEIHCLLAGSPGIGKSRLLAAAVRMSPKGVYVCGNTATGAGLTAAVVREPSTGDFALEAGALVLADGGMCGVDEFDKMANGERHSFLEAMEHQSVSVAKAGIVRPVSARCSVVAAANPKDGKYVAHKTLMENLKVTAALLSRFDLVFVIRDQMDPQHDLFMTQKLIKMRNLRPLDGDERGLSTQMMLEGGGGGGLSRLLDDSLVARCKAVQQTGDLLPAPLFQTLVRYARAFVAPRLSEPAKAELKRLYLQLREGVNEHSRSLPVTPRQLEALIRLSQARARAELSEEVTVSHVRDVWEIVQETELGSRDDVADPEAWKGPSGRLRTGKSPAAKAAIIRKALAQKFSKGASVSREDLKRLFGLYGVDRDMFDVVLEAVRDDGSLLKAGTDTFKVNV